MRALRLNLGSSKTEPVSQTEWMQTVDSLPDLLIYLFQKEAYLWPRVVGNECFADYFQSVLLHEESLVDFDPSPDARIVEHYEKGIDNLGSAASYGTLLNALCHFGANVVFFVK